ncbi:copper chaperone PCu(A)C [Erythrobacter sp. sf7]|uniref:Copper chaperone PCu(A)C n=1 Tax=Erythrobacter fulvus TaxID=2987523 RepID=A0ABT5JNX4_9SPHN|nr:copper chaperone PCu(A)C [Erythrobacter fulvus]MDC8753297.1 copper chaperone PCu(A)C [Erythrobacter fulvus]
MKNNKGSLRVLRKGALAAGIAAAMLGLSACGGEADAPAAEAVAGQVPGMTISNARLVLAPVAGNPAAVYFDLDYQGDQGLTIRKADVEGAGMTMMHDYGEYDFKVQMMEALPIALTKGSKVSFEPGGLHIMAMEPSADLAPGDKVKVTLTMSGGATQEFEAEVRAAGEER